MSCAGFQDCFIDADSTGVENYDLKAVEVVVFMTEAHVFLWTARGRVKTHATAFRVSYL